ncbi:MAG: hypothetical protein H0U86_07165 [Chloroflexi bacterium]|nr:hypothetical protein [Chloroflexota bacterium]
MMSRHRADPVSLMFGLLFAAIGLILLSGGDGALSLAWVGPLTAVALGALLILAARSTRTAPDEQPPED